MDDIDVKIIKILRKNGRISMQHLAKEINMSGPAATDRVKKLEDAGIITGYGAHIDEAKLGRPLHAFITATVSIENRKRLYAYIEECVSIVRAYYVFTGGTEVIMEVYATGTDEIGRIQRDLFELAMTTTHIVMNEPLKDSLFPGHVQGSFFEDASQS